MSTRTSIFREIKPGVYYGVYRHHDGYPECAGEELNEAIRNDELDKHMSTLFNRYQLEYEDYSFNDIMEMWENSDHEFGYIVHLDGTAEVYDITFGPGLTNNKIKYLGELKNVLTNGY